MRCEYLRVMGNYGRHQIRLNLFISILTFFISFQVLGQNSTFLKTTNKKTRHYIELSNEYVKVYKMGRYIDKAGTGPAILNTATLVITKQNEFKGKFYTLLRNETVYTLISDNGKKYQTEPESELKVNTDLNNAYCLKSYFDLSHKLNQEFPLYHHSFRNGYYAWAKHPDKSVNHYKFIAQTKRELEMIYYNVSKEQHAFTNTTNFIATNAGKVNYSILKDSISTLPIDYRPQSGYFDKSVYEMAKANPEYFYKLLKDFPTSKQFIYLAVDHDKELVNQLKQVQGYNDLKKDFLEDYKFGKTMPHRFFGMYAIIAGLLTWLIIAQP